MFLAAAGWTTSQRRSAFVIVSISHLSSAPTIDIHEVNLYFEVCSDTGRSLVHVACTAEEPKVPLIWQSSWSITLWISMIFRLLLSSFRSVPQRTPDVLMEKLHCTSLSPRPMLLWWGLVKAIWLGVTSTQSIQLIFSHPKQPSKVILRWKLWSRAEPTLRSATAAFVWIPCRWRPSIALYYIYFFVPGMGNIAKGGDPIYTREDQK